MKRVLVIIPLLLLLVQCAFAQISTYPWTEDFESNSFETNGWTTSVLTGSAEWGIGTGGTGYNNPLEAANGGNYNAIISNEQNSGDTAMLLSPVFARPNADGPIEISFYYANPKWSNDYDVLIVKYIDAENSSTLLIIEDYNDDWTLATIELPISSVAATFQIGFVGVPRYGYGFLLDDIEINVEGIIGGTPINTYPWSDDFESFSFETNGWTTSILAGSAFWAVGAGDAQGSALTLGHSGDYNAIISNSRTSGDTAMLLSPVFARPNADGTIKISFYYANPAWEGDYDVLIVKYIDAYNSSTLLTIENNNEEWTLANLELPVSSLAATFQIGFVGVPRYGHGFLIDDVELDFDETIVEETPIDTYPWCEDFESGVLGANGFTANIVSGSVNWHIGTGAVSDSYFDEAHSGSYNAIVNNSSHSSDTACLLSPVFVRPNNIDTLELSFYFANPDWSGDYYRLIVNYRDETGDSLLLSITSSYDQWTRKKIQLPVAGLAETFQIAFYGIPKYGYGFLLDDICMKEYEGTHLDVVDTDTYRQVGTGDETVTLPVETSSGYGYTQQIFLSDEMGGAKTIYSLSFEYSGNVTEEVQRNVKIYMANTEKSSFINYYDYVPYSNLTKVFSGVMTIPAEASWTTIVLETPFEYDGTSNLVLAVSDNTGTNTDDRLFVCSELEDFLSIASYSSYNIEINNTVYGELKDIRNNVRFGIVEQTPVLPAVDVEETSAYLQVGTSTTDGRNMLPLDVESNWCMSQQIFDSREMGGEKTIYSLSFNYLDNPNGNITRNLKVYLAHTDMDEFDIKTDVVDWTDMTKVYSGQLNIEGESGWATFVLNAPFHYNGTDNLIVAILDVTGSTEENPVLFACSNIEKSRAYSYSNYYSIIYDGFDHNYGSMYYYRSNIRFGLEYAEPSQYVVDVEETDAYLQVGTGNAEVAGVLPIKTNQKWSYSQQIFTAEDFGGSRTIYSLSFNYTGNTNGEFTRNVKAYLGHTQKDEFDLAGEDMLSIAEMTKVYSGTMHFDAESGWTMLVLDNPFVYNGTDNLVVAVVDISNTENSLVSFVCSDVIGSTSFAASSSYSVSLSSTSFIYNNCGLHYYRNNVRFGLEYVEPPAHVVDTIETAEYLQVGTAEVGTTGELPTNTYYSYGYSQQLFASYEMGGPRTIYTVSFNYSNNSYDESINRNLKLYMGHTSKYEFDFGNDWVSSNLVNVSSQNVLIEGESGWITFVLRTPFEYNGTDNLVVAVRDNTGDYLYGIQFNCSASEYQSAIYSYNDGDAIYNLSGEQGSIISSRNNIRFGLEYVEPPVYYVDTLETETYLQVGTGTHIREALPVNTAGKYGYSQQIFNAMEMGGERTIHSVSFNCITNDNSDAVRNVKLYMGHTNAFEFEYKDWIASDALTLVYDGEFTIPAYSGWITVILDQPFEYNGTDNLVFAWLDNTGTAHSERHFACTNSDLGNSIAVVRNFGAVDIANTENLMGNILQYRSDIRFGTESVTVYNLDVSANDAVMGIASGSGRYEEGSIVSVSATAYPCFRFSKWSDGVPENPRQVEMTSDISLVAMFENIGNDTLNYDNDIYNISLGYHQQNVEWGISLMPQHLASRPHLTDVLFYVDGEHSYGEYRLAVYQGFDTLPSECILRDTITVEINTEGWINFGFDTIDIDTTRALWVILSSESDYPATASTFVGAGYENGAWWNPNGTWTQQTYGSWMIKAVLPIEENGGSGEEEAVDIVSVANINIYPNPVNSYFYIEGVADGEPIEIFSIDGRMVADFKYNGDAINVTNLPAGMYVLRCNGYMAKFVKE